MAQWPRVCCIGLVAPWFEWGDGLSALSALRWSALFPWCLSRINSRTQIEKFAAFSVGGVWGTPVLGKLYGGRWSRTRRKMLRWGGLGEEYGAAVCTPEEADNEKRNTPVGCCSGKGRWFQTANLAAWIFFGFRRTKYSEHRLWSKIDSLGAARTC